MERVCVVFTLNELWLLQGCVRHEIAPHAPEWKYPPASLDFNDTIAEAILFCTDNKLQDAGLMLSRHDCLIIDHNVDQSQKDVNGIPIGRTILLKSFIARKDLADDTLSSAEPENIPSINEVRSRLFGWKNDTDFFNRYPE